MLQPSGMGADKMDRTARFVFWVVVFVVLAITAFGVAQYFFLERYGPREEGPGSVQIMP